MAGPRITICSGCLEDFQNNDLYTVSRFINRSVGIKSGLYGVPYCEKCIKDTDSYHKITTQPKNKIKEALAKKKPKKK